MRTIVWFRGKDLRVCDHEPLSVAAADGEVIPLFVLEPIFLSSERVREAPYRTQYFLESLRELAMNLRERGSRLVLVRGPSTEVLPRLAHLWKVDRVWALRRSEPLGRQWDAQVSRSLAAEVKFFEGETLIHPSSVRTQAGRHYTVYTPFRRAVLDRLSIRTPLPAPRSISPLPADLTLLPVPIPKDSEVGLVRNQQVLEGGETAARARLRAFMSRRAMQYDVCRNRLGRSGTSRLSADLKFGTLSIREVWNAAERRLGNSPAGIAFRNQLLWREFSYNILWNQPGVLERPFKERFAGFPWKFDSAIWRAWTEGRTGYPIVDASARQLVQEGFVHNRARMVSASFLTKHLLFDYRLGESHYMKYLTDGDRAQNNMGWQWAAGCGCDAQPYFRVFNPVRQGERFDPDGAYVRRWLPELGKVPDRFVHRPWDASDITLEKAGVRLGRDYPYPIVDHAGARRRYLDVAREYLRSRQT